MSHTETSTKSWFSRLSESIKGVLFGILLFAISFPLLSWNESRAVKQSQALKDGAASVVTIEADTVNPEYDGFLVHLSGQAVSDAPLVDPSFELHANSALRLKRTAEMYQWKEIKSEKKEKKAGGSEKTTTTYTYERVWSENLIDSSGFREEGHDNPRSMPHRTQTFDSRNATIGAFRLGNLVSRLNSYEEFSVEDGEPQLQRPEAPEEVDSAEHEVEVEDELEPVASGNRDPFANRDAQRAAQERKREQRQRELERERRRVEEQQRQQNRDFQLAQQRFEIEQSARRQRLSQFKQYDGGYYLGEDPSNPTVGDSRIKFSVIPDQEVSILAQQHNSGFQPYQMSNNSDLYRIMTGEHTAAEMFHQMELENTQTTWIFRGLGFFLMFLGIMMVFRPLVVVADVIPLFGSLLSAGSFVFALLLAAPLTLTTIAVSWFAVRPLLTAGLMVGAAFFGYLAIKVGRRKRKS